MQQYYVKRVKGLGKEKPAVVTDVYKSVHFRTHQARLLGIRI